MGIIREKHQNTFQQFSSYILYILLKFVSSTTGARITVMGSTLNYRQEVIGEEVIYLDSKSYVTLTTEAKSSIERAQPNCP